MKIKLFKKAPLLGLITIFVFLAVGLFAPAQSSAGEKNILLLHTNNVTGHLFPCPT